MVATGLVHGSTRLKAFTPERLACRDTRDLMTRIDLVVEPEIDARFPGRRAARVSMEARDGRRAEHLQPDRKGDPELPLTDRDLEEKFAELAEPVIGSAKADELLARIKRLEHEKSV